MMNKTTFKRPRFTKKQLDELYGYFVTVDERATTADLVEYMNEVYEDMAYEDVHRELFKLRDQHLIRWDSKEREWQIVHYRVAKEPKPVTRVVAVDRFGALSGIFGNSHSRVILLGENETEFVTVKRKQRGKQQAKQKIEQQKEKQEAKEEEEMEELREKEREDLPFIKTTLLQQFSTMNEDNEDEEEMDYPRRLTWLTKPLIFRVRKVVDHWYLYNTVKEALYELRSERLLKSWYNDRKKMLEWKLTRKGENEVNQMSNE